MKFDYTKGKEARYIVSLHSWNISDHYYTHTFKDAVKLFDRLKGRLQEGMSVSVYDLKKDLRKAFAKAD